MIVTSTAKTFVSSLEDEEIEQYSSDGFVDQPRLVTQSKIKATHVVKDDNWYDDLDADVDSSESSRIKSHLLKGFKQRVQGEQIEKYEQIRRAHMVFRLNGFESVEGQRAMTRAESLVKQVYHE